MKAKEYAEKYSALANMQISDRDFIDGVKNLFNELKYEMCDIAEKRGIKTFSGLTSLEKEFNVKANKISDLLNSAFKKDWYLILLSELENEYINEQKGKEE